MCRKKSIKSMREQIETVLCFIGEDTDREGLKDTPERVVKSWAQLYSGYDQNPKDLFTCFSETEQYSEMVLLKDIEFYSMCEHHMLPFYGKAHVAYIPGQASNGQKGRVVGISKLARLVDIYARRLQIQERICRQVTNALEDYLGVTGAACIIEAQHLCMIARGVQKQNSVMVTSSLTGCFLESDSARAELMGLIK